MPTEDSVFAHAFAAHDARIVTPFHEVSFAFRLALASKFEWFISCSCNLAIREKIVSFSTSLLLVLFHSRHNPLTRLLRVFLHFLLILQHLLDLRHSPLRYTPLLWLPQRILVSASHILSGSKDHQANPSSIA